MPALGVRALGVRATIDDGRKVDGCLFEWHPQPVVGKRVTDRNNEFRMVDRSGDQSHVGKPPGLVEVPALCHDRISCLPVPVLSDAGRVGD